MAKLMNVAILLLVLVAVIPQSTEAADHVVGGATGWIIPPGGASFYSNWAANITFRVNDTLVFNFNTGVHNVIILTKDNFDNCDVSNEIQSFNTGPARVTLNRTGEFYFACGVPTHCSNGQKLSVNVSGSSSSPAPGQAPAEAPSSPKSGSEPTSPTDEGSPSSPTGPGATAPPPQGAATSIAATFSILLMTMAMNLLF